MYGLIEHEYEKLFMRSVKNDGMLTYEDILDYIKALQSNEMHAHVVIQGANGLGKSYLMLSLMKLYNNKPIKEQKIMFADNSTIDLIETIATSENDIIGIDELKALMFYLDTMQTENKQLLNYIEYAREKRNAFISCAKDIRRIDNKYREGQAQMLIWIYDRFPKPKYIDGKKYISYAGVYVAHPTIEQPDKFQLGLFNYAFDTKTIYYLSENFSKTFVGYLLVRDALDGILTEEDIKDYKSRKLRSIEQKKEIAKEEITYKQSAKRSYDDFLKKLTLNEKFRGGINE